MGDCTSKEEVEQRLATQEDAARREWENSKNALTHLDAKTRVPHLLIEVRSLGFVEIQGKDTGGIYHKLEEWLIKNWGAQKKGHDLMQCVSPEQECGCCGYGTYWALAPMQEHHRLCDMSYTLGPLSHEGHVVAPTVYKARGMEGENNMGKLTMQLSSFMTNECGWTLQVCDGGNLGFRGQIREQQMKFKAPHPLNLLAPLVMIELRQVGYIEVNGPDVDGLYDKITSFVSAAWRARKVTADPDYCALKFSTSAFQKRGGEGENNMGLRTMELVDFMVKKCQWTMVVCNGGNYGRKGDKREQQLVFRNDEFVQHGVDHIMVELRTIGYIEINGLHDAEDLKPHLVEFMTNRWQCTPYKPYLWEQGAAPFCDLKYTCPPGFYYRRDLANNLGKRTLELAEFLAGHGWALLLCNGGSVTPNPQHNPNHIIREQQVKFTRVKKQEKAKAPLLMIELRTQPTSLRPPRYDGLIEVCGKDTNGIYSKLRDFFTQHMGGREAGRPPHCDALYVCEKIRLKPSKRVEDRWDGFLNGESNLGKWTMRICDFMVDHLGEWDLIVCNSDNLDQSWKINKDDFAGVTAREMQMVFRHRPQGRAVFMSNSDVKPLGHPPKQPPQYWSEPRCISGEMGHKIQPGTAEELGWMQEILDKTFKNKVTRDRTDGKKLAGRYVAVQCLRSEHPFLWDRFAKRREAVAETCKASDGAIANFVVPKTMPACEALALRCTHARVGNPANQAYLLHGTNPTSAVAILSSSFQVNLAGKTAGTMFGPGVYLAESSTKADEYARDDAGGEYDGLYAVIICRVVLGRSFVTEKPGDYSDKVTSGEYEHVLGDREKAVGTFREFVLFHEESIYPEYAVFYRRERDGVVLSPEPAVDAPHQEEMPHQVQEQEQPEEG